MAMRWWRSVPAQVRKPAVLFVGLALVMTAGAIGWLPGPGGIPLFLVGVAILATEFVWAEKFRDKILALIRWSAAFVKTHPVVGTLLVISAFVGLCTSALLYYYLFRRY